jgi:hypothetical protein
MPLPRKNQTAAALDPAINAYYFKKHLGVIAFIIFALLSANKIRFSVFESQIFTTF